MGKLKLGHDLVSLAAVAIFWLLVFPGAGLRRDRHATHGTEAFAQELHLKPAQVDSINAILDDTREAVRQINSELSRVRASLVRALAKGSADKIETLNREHTALHVRISAVESAALARIFGLLEPGQKSHAEAALGHLWGAVHGNRHDRSTNVI